MYNRPVNSATLAITIVLILLFVGAAVKAQDGPGSVSATVSGAGAGTDGSVVANRPFQFDVHITGLVDYSILAISNGFRVYSPDGAAWQPIVCDSFSIGWPSRFDLMPFSVYYHGVTGSGADSVVVGTAASNGPGLELGFDGDVWYIATSVYADDVGKTICLDSCFCPPNAAWMWSLTGATPFLPAWGGPYCYLIEDNPAWNPGDSYKMHFPQLPDSNGWDCDMAWWPARITLADDWQCSETGWVKSIHWWGSWWQGVEGALDTLHIAICKDTIGVWGVPQPGRVLWEMALTDIQEIPKPYADSQNWFQPSGGHDTTFEAQAFYQFGIFLDEADWFWQEEGTVYWLALSTRAVDVQATYLGWRSSANHWREPAIWGQYFDDWYPDPQLAEPPDWLNPLDLAFVIAGDPGSCCQIVGDINHDGAGPDIADLVYLVTYMFSGGPEPPCLDEADIDGSGVGPDISDLVYLVTYMFQSGPAPVPCP